MFELETILCCTEPSSQDDSALGHALKIALHGRGELIVAHAEGEFPQAIDSATAWVRNLLARWGVLSPGDPDDALEALGLSLTELHVPGQPQGSLSQLIAQRRPDLLVAATAQRTGLERWLHPSVAEALARATRIPTLFVPRGGDGWVDANTGELRLSRVLVPVARWPDGSVAAQLAQRLASTLRLEGVHYRTLFLGEARDAPSVDRMQDRGQWEHKSAPGHSVAPAVASEADGFGADLIAMATDGHHGRGDRLFGSTVERVIRRAGCPVLVAPPTL